MPRKRGGGKARTDLPLIVQALLEGTPIAPTVENHDALASIRYFSAWADELDDAAQARVVTLLSEWRKRHIAGTLPNEAA